MTSKSTQYYEKFDRNYFKNPKKLYFMHKKIFNHDSCKKNKIIVSKKNLHEKKKHLWYYFTKSQKNQRNVKGYISFFYVIFLHKINVIIFCRIHCNLEINDEIKMMTVLHALFVTLK